MIDFVGLVLLTAAFLLPGHYPPWMSFEQEAMACCALCLLGIGRLAKRDAAPLRVPLLASAAAVAAAVPWFQWAGGQIVFFSDALLSSAYASSFAFAVVVGASTDRVDQDRLLVGLGWALVVAGLVSTGIALLQFLGRNWLQVFQIDAPPGGRPFGNLGQRNHFSTLLALSIASALLLHGKGRLAAPLAAAAVACAAFGIVMSQSRTGWAFAVLLLLWWACMRKRAALRIPAPAALAALALFLASVLAWNPLTQTLQLPSETLGARLAPGTRFENWRTLWDAALRSPWIGYGWSQVAQAQQAVVLDHAGSHEWLQSSHNAFLDLILWNGFPIGGLLIAALVAWFVRQVRLCRTPEQWSLLAGVGALWLHAMLEYPLSYLYFLLPLGLMTGLLEGLCASGAGALRLARVVYVGALAALIGLLGWVSVEYLRVQDATRQLRFVMARIGTDKVSTAPPPDVALLDQPREFHRFWLAPVTAGMGETQLAWMRDVSRRQPVPSAMSRYALAAGLNGHPQEARDTLARLCKMHDVKRCDEGREAWRTAQAQHPELRAIDYPRTIP